MAGKPGKARRVVRLTPAAISDLANIYAYTAGQWSPEQAKEYKKFLRDAMNALAKSPESATPLRDEKDHRVLNVRWPGAHFGHRIFFVQIPGGIRVIPILHTSMNWPDHLK